MKDLVELPSEVKADMTFESVETLDDVVGQLFTTGRAKAPAKPPRRPAARPKASPPPPNRPRP
jgi:ATP-dependent Lon protease